MIGPTISRYRIVENPPGGRTDAGTRLDRSAAPVRFVLLLLLSVRAFAGNDIAVAVGRPTVGDTTGNAIYASDSWDEQQSAKPGLALGAEYRHWFTNRSGFQVDFNRTNTNATFKTPLASVSFSVKRYEMSGAFVRYFGRPESKLHPFLNVGPGILLFSGGYAPGGTVGWSASLEGIISGGFDTPVSRHLSVRTAYRFHFFRNTNYGDPAFRPGFAHIQEPTVGLSWKF